MSLRSLAVALGVAVAALATSVHADQVVLGPSKDNTLFESATGDASNGIGPRFYVGQNAEDRTRRGLVAFDLGSVPPGSTVTGVTLTLYMSRSLAAAQPVTLHRALADWGEGASYAGGTGGGTGITPMPGDATWIHRFYPDVLWGTPGGEFVAAASATTSVGSIGSYSWSGPGLVADVQAWVNAPATNFGWVVRGNEAEPQTAKRFESREGVTTQRPRLTIQYTPPAGAVGACCLDGGCQLLTPAQCAAAGGVYQGDATACVPNPCGPAVGACCLPDGACQELSAADCTAAGGMYRGDGTPCGPLACSPVLEPFVDPLPIPAVAQPVSGVPGGAAHYEIAMTQFQQQLHRDLPPTTVWGYGDAGGGSFPGPTIEAARGQPVTVTWINDLRDAQGVLRSTHYLPVDHCPHGAHAGEPEVRTVVHLHGGHVPADSDGYPEDTFLPGQQSAPYDYPNNQPAATLWYHDHALGITRLNVYMGLAGFYLIRDAQEAALNLPSGEHEIPLVIQDRSFNFDGSLRYPQMWHEHFHGDFILVNGKVWPYLNVKKGKYRFRMLNGSGSRTYQLSLSSGATFFQIGTDGGLLPAPVALTSLILAPGERADVVIDFGGHGPGTEIVLTNSAPTEFPGVPGVGVIPQVMKFIVQGESGHAAPLPASLVDVEPLPLAAVSTTRQLVLRRYSEPCAGVHWLINGLMWDDITEFPRLGSTEIWSFVNRSSVTHPMHMHLVQFQVLDRQPFQVVFDEIVPVGVPVPADANEAGWKDTVRVNPFEIVRVIARFEGYTGLFAYHCHILEHEDHEMMRQFRTTCAADWNTDLSVNSNDISAFLAAWLGSLQNGDLIADFNGDHLVNSNDISAFLSAWLNALTTGC